MEIMKTETNRNFWDCDCDFNYIHPKKQKKCTACGKTSGRYDPHSDQPDSRKGEIVRFGVTRGSGYSLDRYKICDVEIVCDGKHRDDPQPSIVSASYEYAKGKFRDLTQREIDFLHDDGFIDEESTYNAWQDKTEGMADMAYEMAREASWG